MLAQKVIEQLGYTPSEAKIYLATLGLGEARITKIASKAKVPRTSAEAIAEKLREDGLMDFYVQRRYKYWTAENPEHLLTGIDKRGAAVRAALPALKKIRQSARTSKSDSGDTLEHAQFLRILANASVQPMLIANENVEIEYVNPAWEEQFGYALDEVRGENPRILQSGKTPKAIYERMWEALRAGKTFQTDEIIDMRSDGSFFNLVTTIFLLEYVGHHYYVQILSDTTEQKQVAALKSGLFRFSGLSR